MIKQRISIGIPAFNEEQNIVMLIQLLLAQKETNYQLIEIIIISDGSTDNTVQSVKTIFDKRIKIINGKKRLGKSARINHIFSIFSGDYLFLMDADIAIKDSYLIADTIKKLCEKKIDLIAIEAVPLPADNFFEKCINHSVSFQNDIRKKWHDGQNYLAFKGCFLVLSRNLAKSIHLHDVLVNNDAYIYFYAKNNKYNLKYITDSNVYYKSPSSFRDHYNQSSRFQGSYPELSKYFGKTILIEYHVPLSILLLLVIKYMIKNPFLFVGYIIISVFSKIIQKKPIINTWEIANSTKKSNNSENSFIAKYILKIRKTLYVSLHTIDKIFKRKNNIFILCYHDIADDNWRFSINNKEIKRQITYLGKHYAFVNLEDVKKHILGIKQITQPSVVITFDDGYKNVMRLRDVFAKYHTKPTLFILSETVDADRSQTSKTSKFLNGKELHMLKNDGWTIGSHSATHADFSFLSRNEIVRQIHTSKNILERKLKIPITYFAYPKGIYSKKIVSAVKNAKYSVGLSMDDGKIDSLTNLYAIPRVGIDRSHTFSEFKAAYSPSVILLRQLVKKYMKGVINAAIS